MSAYTPTTEDVEFCYVGRGRDAGERSAGFYRWLAGVKAQALEEAADDVTNIDGRKDDKAAKWLRTRAQQLKEEA